MVVSTLVKRSARPWPKLAGWLVPGSNCTALGQTIVLRAFADVGIEEVPVGSNRGVRIDAMTGRAGLPVEQNTTTHVGWYWCGIWVGTVWIDCGALVPQDYASCDAWLASLNEPTYVPQPGDAILYGLKKGLRYEQRTSWDAHHIGLVARTAPLVRTIEGNRSFAGTASNNGQAVDYGPLARQDVLGYITPRRST